MQLEKHSETGQRRATFVDDIASPELPPSASDIRVNCLWFLSLIFSLTTVLVGILVLQWLREHQRPRGDLAPQLAYSLLNMHTEALDRWFIPQIITFLPLLLQGGLVFFFVGMVDFLWQLDRRVAYPVMVFICLTLLFLVLTTLLPTLQSLTLFLPRRKRSRVPRAPCPYKSRQSWAFHELVAPFARFAEKYRSGTPWNKIFDLKLDAVLLPGTIVSDDRPTSAIPRATETIFRQKLGGSWLNHGIAWLYQRDIDRILAEPDLEPLTMAIFEKSLPTPIYDAINALSNSVKSASLRKKEQWIAVDRCFHRILDLSYPQHQHAGASYTRYLQRLLIDPSSLRQFSTIQPSKQAIPKEDILFRFHKLTLHYKSNGPSSQVQIRHRLKVAISLTRWLFGGGANSSRLTASFDILPITWVELLLEKGKMANDRGEYRYLLSISL